MDIVKKLRPIRTVHKRAFARLAMNRYVPRLLSPFGRDLNPDRWIFVIGCYNSGTTLLANILRQHQLIGGLPSEGAYLTDGLPYPEQCGWPRMWCRCIDHVRLEEDEEDEKRAKRIKRHWSFWYPKDTPNFVEKTVSNAARIPFLEKNFKPAYFIYIVRNGYAVANGIQRKADLKRWNNSYQGKGYPIELCAEQWKITDEIVQHDSEKVERFLTVKYESLTENPTSTLNTITEFLGLPAIQSEVFDIGWNIHDVSSSIKNMNDRSLKNLSMQDIEVIEKVAGCTLQKYGYTKPTVS